MKIAQIDPVTMRSHLAFLSAAVCSLVSCSSVETRDEVMRREKLMDRKTPELMVYVSERELDRLQQTDDGFVSHWRLHWCSGFAFGFIAALILFEVL